VKTFPAGFVWGSATSAYQIEGAAHEDGRGESIWDRFARMPGRIKDGSNGDVACDHYHRWRSDIALMKSLGHAAYRFSVAWPRILPSGRGSINEKGVDFYSRLVDGLLEAGIAPYLTLYHWDLPQVLQDSGGWVNRATAEAFADYAAVVSRRLGDRVKHWITHNEPWCASMVSNHKGVHAPGLRDGKVAVAVSHHLLLSHGLALNVVRDQSRGAQIGITLNLSPVLPASPSRADAEAARHYDGYLNRWFLDPVLRGQYPADMVRDYAELGFLPAGSNGLNGCMADLVRDGDLRVISAPTDFLGVNYYNRAVVRSDRIPEAQNELRTVFLRDERTDIGWEVYAEGLEEVLLRVHREYQPAKILVTENGASYGDGPDPSGRVPDAKRVTFLRNHLLSMHRAIEAGVPVEGYFAWSLMDNYEWDHGYTQRFGLTWVDYPTQRRIPKDSAAFYRGVIEANAVDF
jgi:beta-glucosidase